MFKKRKRVHTDMALAITPMADIFTILLVFLLKSFSTGASSITPSGTIVLPESERADPVVEVGKVEISDHSILVEEKSVVQLHDYRFDPNDISGEATKTALQAAFRHQRSKDSIQKSSKMLLLADQKTPFLVLRTVMGVAAEFGYTDYKLLVVEGQ